VLPLDPDFGEWTSSECGAVMLQILGHPDLRVFWGGDELVESEKMARLDDATFRAHSVRLEGTVGLQRLVVGDAIEASEFEAFAPDVDDEPRPFGWSGRTLDGPSTIVRRELLPDGCLAVEQETATDRATLYFCLPDWAFPFSVGEAVSVVESRLHGSTRRLTVLSAGTAPAGSLDMWLGATPSANLPAEVSELTGTGRRTRCGAWVAPLAVRPSPPPGQLVAPFLATGDGFEWTNDGEHRRVLVGRAERVVVAPASCEPERAALFSTFDLLTLRLPQSSP
jgi:hypothetical protein